MQQATHPGVMGGTRDRGRSSAYDKDEKLFSIFMFFFFVTHDFLLTDFTYMLSKTLGTKTRPFYEYRLF